MKSNSYFSLLKIVLHGRSAGNILLATCISLTFSISVILCTFGLMDGFDHLLKSGLRHSSGDLIVSSKRGFFSYDKFLRASFKNIHPKVVAPVVQTEAFGIANGLSKGVLVRGVENDNFSDATGLRVHIPESGIVIGKELARQLGLKIGDSLALTLGRGNEAVSALPSVKLFTVAEIVEHGIYQKDLRFVYVNRGELAELLNVGNKVNLIILGLYDAHKPLEDLEALELKRQDLRLELDSDFYVKLFWSEYGFLIEAVKVEKLSISLILQLIVVVAIFNIVAFVIYIMEKKAQEFFFLRAVGLSLNKMMNFWVVSILGLWLISCVGAFFLSQLFNLALRYLPFFQIPGEIYVLSSLQIKLNLMAYLTVYMISLIWIILAALIGYWRLKRVTIIQGLRQEFS
jgi:ABC-type lipoprotein release transport system permease subunit